MRSLVLAVVVASAASFAQAISGTASTAFEGFNMYGVPQTRLTLNLSCSLTCPSSAPELHYGAIVDAWLPADPMTKTGYVSAFFGSDPTGQNTKVSDQFPAGSALFIIAKSCTCWCGGRTGEGGYIDLTSNVTAIPPWPSGGVLTQGDANSFVLVAAKPVGNETVELHLTGAGVDLNKTWTPADFGTQSAVSYTFKPLAAGTLTMTATLQPYGATYTATAEVKPGSSSGTGGGGGSSGTGGGTGGGGGGDPVADPGCSTSGAAGLGGLVALFLRRRSLAR